MSISADWYKLFDSGLAVFDAPTAPKDFVRGSLKNKTRFH
jgi:hypothetical protein